MGVRNHRPTIRATIAIARILAHMGIKAAADDPSFGWVCRDVLNTDTAKVTRDGLSLMNEKISEGAAKRLRQEEGRSCRGGCELELTKGRLVMTKPKSIMRGLQNIKTYTGRVGALNEPYRAFMRMCAWRWKRRVRVRSAIAPCSGWI